MTIPRSLLTQAFPDSPRLRAQLEAALNLVDSLQSEADSLKSQIAAILASVNTVTFQPESDVLTEIAGIPNKVGAVEMTTTGATVRPIDGADPASLLSRGASYELLVGIAGKGTTPQRPTIPANAVALYFDTTLAANGKPIFWNKTQWVDSTGTAV